MTLKVHLEPNLDLLCTLTSAAVRLSSNYECAVLLNVDQINLNLVLVYVHDGKSLLPICHTLCVSSLFKVHQIAYLNTMQDTPYAASRGL